MEKYMGNKSKLLEFIYENVEKNRKKTEKSIFDAFTGTTNVGKYFKKKGYDVTTNDINDLSLSLGKCYIENCKIPVFDNLINSNTYFSNNYKKVINTDTFNEHLKKLIFENKNTVSQKFLKENKDSTYFKVLTYLTYYASPGDYDSECEENNDNKTCFLQKNYCEFGDNSKYINLVYKKTLDNILKNFEKKGIQASCVKNIKSFFKYPHDVKYLDKVLEVLDKKSDEYEKISNIIKKGNVVGERKFFSIEHAKRLDIILNTIVYWNNNGYLEDYEYDILITGLIETITIFSNTSATYQAFYKDYRANTLQPFRIVIPEIIIGKGTYKCYQNDVFNTVDLVESDILYLDPPYNWRQYDSNYHLLNTIAKYNKIKDIEKFEKNIVGASGENRVEKLKYTSFNQRATFEEQLFELIKLSKSKLIVLSYSDSESNHQIKQINTTIEKISTFMKDENIFIPGSFKLIKYNRKNFESRKDNKKASINELLFIARKW